MKTFIIGTGLIGGSMALDIKSIYDDAIILEVVSIIFEDAGYEVKISETSHDIIEKVSHL